LTNRGWSVGSDDEYWQQAVSHLGLDLAQRFGRVTALVLDADGVLTSGQLWYDETGETLKQFDSQDGLGIVMARVAGLKMAILTGRVSPIVARRAEELRFDAIRLGRYDKLMALQEILAEIDTAPERTLYVGDDLLDLPALTAVAVPVAVANAVEDVRRSCCYVTRAPGGGGAVREVIELVLKCRRLYATALERLARPAASPDEGGTP
jgi:3-deoxy-D-manno-octulosonate 8-phosphate phosphatase (KDO 8-P phosphatase)